jgi:antitoxin component of RelBE/YafQ-DinJ toxin-antitoxin module
MRKPNKSPSRIKYEQSHPTISGRLPIEARDKLLANLAKLGMTISDALMVLAGELEIKVIPIDEARKQGFEEAMKLYMVTYQCFICRKLIAITSPETKKVVGKFLTEHGWGHPKCIELMGRT